MSQKNQIWAQHGGQFYLEYPSIEHSELENAIYTVKFNDNIGKFYLEKVADSYVFDYKIYAMEDKLISRLLKTYENTDGNLGMLLNGVKGTGKTVTSKQIANKLEQPTIVVTSSFGGAGVQYFLNSIPQNITIFIDEYEKIFGESNAMLTIMDGAMNSEFRRVFLMTTNRLYIEDNLKQRPSRLRYLKEFKDLSPSVVEEIVDDILENKDLRDDCINFMTTLSLITVDIVKEVLNEVNIHNESPFEFADIFNVSKIENKFKVYELDTNQNETLLIENANLYPRPKYNEDYEGYCFDINGKEIGRVSKVHGPDVIEVDLIEYNDNDEEVVTETIVLKVMKSYGTHMNYAYVGDGEYGYGENINSTKSTERADKLMGKDPKSGKKSHSKKSGEVDEVEVKMEVTGGRGDMPISFKDDENPTKDDENPTKG
jgi:hypothetical protein